MNVDNSYHRQYHEQTTASVASQPTFNQIFLWCYHIVSHCTNARRIRCQADLNSFPLGELQETTGMPRTTWIKSTQQDLKSMNVSLNEETDVAQNRPLWRLMCTCVLLTHSGACQKWIYEWMNTISHRYWRYVGILIYFLTVSESLCDAVILRCNT